MTDVFILGDVSRNLPAPAAADGRDLGPLRVSRYGELFVMPVLRKQHALADEGTYFVVNNAQSGIASPAVATFGATTPMIAIANTDTANGGKRIYLDYINLVTTAAGGWGSAGVNAQLMVYLDIGDRSGTAGSSLTANIVSPNMDNGAKSIATVRFGALTATAATNSARCICGLRILRPAVSATVADVVGETKQLNFGGVEAMLNGAITVASANMISVPLPPIIIGPVQSCLIYYVLNGTSPTAASFAPEMGWWER